MNKLHEKSFMKLYTNCTSCKKDINITSSAETRPDLAIEKGNEFTVNCLHCGKTDQKHVNDTRATPNKKVILIGIIIGIVATLLLFGFYGIIGIAGLSIPILFWKQQTMGTSSFNSYMVRRK